MQTEPEIAFRNVDAPEPIEQLIADRIRGLEELDDRLLSCRVMVEMPEKRHHRGNLYHIRIDLTRPGQELIVDRHPSEHHAHEELAQAVGEAFDTARQRLLDARAKRRGEVKRHETTPRGRVRTLFPREGYGFIEAEDGHDVYFHRNALRGTGFDELEVGARVRYTEETGDEGPQAGMVEVI